MKDKLDPGNRPRALLIPLDDREALLALRDFERPGATAGAAGEAGSPERREPKAA